LLIIGKNSQRDYYDYIATQYGPDKGVVFKRETSTVEFPKASYGQNLEAVPIYSVSIKNNLKHNKYSHIDVIPFVVVVGDFYWSGVKIARYKNDMLGNIDYVSFLYTEEELQEFLEEETLINDRSGGYDREMSYFKGQSYYYLRENTNKTAAFFKSGKRPEWDKRVRKISNGLTILPPAKGQWVNEKDGTLYVERVIPVMIIATADQMKKISKITAKHYDQIAVMYFKMSSESHIDYYA
jgi:hypothetical protein